MKRIYVCENEVTGLFSALYDAWKYLVPDDGASVESVSAVTWSRSCSVNIQKLNRMRRRHYRWNA